ncbi:MAG TPA: LPS export ABC transporter permease LptG [Gammaproteobacteria bacterium]|jgi:lipopolysaccharide export system permease protein|nr:LPS export ABC transporter permease LptG [Gammaproteobacteria bacterium]
MIKILVRYIAKTVMFFTCLSAVVVMGLQCLMLTIAELKNVGQGDFGFLQVLGYVLCQVPNELYQFFPMVVLLGSIVGLSVLSSHRELAVMRTAGFSVKQMTYSVLGITLCLTLLVMSIGELFGPSLSYTAEIRKDNQQNAGQAMVTPAGVWFHVDRNFIHVEHVVSRELLQGVTRYQYDDKHRLRIAYYAETLSKKNNQWELHDVAKTIFYPERTQHELVAVLPWDIKINTNLFSVGHVEASQMSLDKLYRYSRYLKQNGLQASEYLYAFWQRIFQPLASLVMIFLAIPFVLGGVRTTLGWRLIAGVLTGFSFFILNGLLGELCIVYQVPAVLAAIFPTLIFATAGLLLMRKS